MEFETAPWTHVLIDAEEGVVGVAPNYKVAQHPSTVANSLAKVLELSTVNEDAKVSVIIGPINDPTTFVQEVRQAYAVTSFSFTFTRPNPADSDRLYESLAVFLSDVEGTKGEVKFQGQEMDRGDLVSLAEKVTATGDEAKAKVIDEEGDSPKTITTRGTHVSVSTESLDTPDEKLAALRRLTMAKNRVRDGDD